MMNDECGMMNEEGYRLQAEGKTKTLNGRMGETLSKGGKGPQ
jgi:hypothetical protein